MNKLLANLNVLYVKLHNYHYNVIGADFMPTHVALEKEYDTMHEWIDEVAEQIKKDGEYPMGSLKEYLSIATITEVESKDYRSKEILEDVLKDFETLEADVQELLEGDISIACDDLLTTIATELSTKIWFLKAQLA